MTVLAVRGVAMGFLSGPDGEGPWPTRWVPGSRAQPGSVGDDRWPGLTREWAYSQLEDGTVADKVCGVAAVPGVWRADETCVLSCALSGAADASTVTTLIGYEQLVSAALVTSAAEDAGAIADMLSVLQSRGAIEQAKGVIMGRLRCDADAAWSTLRRASHEST